jgi:hypothetical protein
VPQVHENGVLAGTKNRPPRALLQNGLPGIKQNGRERAGFSVARCKPDIRIHNRLPAFGHGGKPETSPAVGAPEGKAAGLHSHGGLNEVLQTVRREVDLAHKPVQSLLILIARDFRHRNILFLPLLNLGCGYFQLGEDVLFVAQVDESLPEGDIEEFVHRAQIFPDLIDFLDDPPENRRSASART